MAGGGVGVGVGGKRGYCNKALHVHSLCPAQLRPTWWNKHTQQKLETVIRESWGKQGGKCLSMSKNANNIERG